MKARHFAWSLVGLAFFSKISFAFTRAVPESLGFLVFQSGIHPYINIVLNFFLGLCFWALLRKERILDSATLQHRIFRIFAWGTIFLLWVLHFFQIVLRVNPDGNLTLVFSTLVSTTFLIVVFGLWIPRVLAIDDFLAGVGFLCTLICVFSILLFFLGFPGLYKGARFVGILKHIPFMVTCATTGFLFNLYGWKKAQGIWKHLLFICFQGVLLYCIFLSGTRSALFAILGGFFVYFALVSSASPSFRMVRGLSLWLFFLGSLLFGAMIVEFGKDLATGKLSLGSRLPQDGVSDRMEEISRGMEMVERSPLVGLGLLSKFSSADGEEVVEKYNSFQDPHNLFISSAVVGGWPLGIWIFFGYGALILGVMAVVAARQEPQMLVGVYLLSHLPILFIYHMHLSLGGLADRLYWLLFGYLGVSLCKIREKEKKSLPTPNTIPT